MHARAGDLRTAPLFKAITPSSTIVRMSVIAWKPEGFMLMPA
jgi:hypothetical protein